jgi:hypothetical protein
MNRGYINNKKLAKSINTRNYILTKYANNVSISPQVGAVNIF